MKLVYVFISMLLICKSASVCAEDLPVEAKKMLDDLGAPEVQQSNNGMRLQCVYGGTKQITVSLLEGATVFSANYNNCREPASTRDGFFEFIVKGGKIVGQSSKRSINGELFDAVQVGDVAKVKSLIRRKADVNYTEPISTTDGGSIDEWTPLMSAAASENNKIVTLLVKAGASVNYLNSQVFNALWLASGTGNLDVVRSLVKHRAYINNRNINDVTPLMNAAINGHAKIVKYLLNVKADINLVHKDGDSALMLALANGHSDVATVLIDSGANINIQNKYGVTALLIAVAEGNEAIVKKLVDMKADMLAKTDDGKIALDVAIAKGNVNIINMLKK